VRAIAKGAWSRAEPAAQAHGCIATFECPECRALRSIMAQLCAIDRKGVVTPNIGQCRCGFDDAIQLVGWST
jgi:hypothetical protein